MGLMFDLFYTKAPIKFRKGGWILHCISFVCTVTVLIGLTFEIISPREDGEKWHKVDIAITEVLVVGALALEIYAVAALYLFSDWSILWLIEHNRLGKQVIQLRKKISWLFLPKQYRGNMTGQLNLLDFCLNGLKPYQKLIKRILRSLLEIDHSKYMLDKYVHKTAVVVNSLLFNPILDCCQRLTRGERLIQDDWIGLSDNLPLGEQIFRFYIATEVCYNLEREWDTHDDASENKRGRVVSQHTMSLSSSSLLWEENTNLCRTLSRYMMYILVYTCCLQILAEITEQVPKAIRNFSSITYSGVGLGTPDVKAACRHLASDLIGPSDMVEHLKSKQKDERWEMLKSTLVDAMQYSL